MVQPNKQTNKTKSWTGENGSLRQAEAGMLGPLTLSTSSISMAWSGWGNVEVGAGWEVAGWPHRDHRDLETDHVKDLYFYIKDTGSH